MSVGEGVPPSPPLIELSLLTGLYQFMTCGFEEEPLLVTVKIKIFHLESSMATNKVLIVIDVQNGFLDRAWGQSHNPKCEDNIRELLQHWRANSWPIVLVRHDSVTPGPTLRPGQPGNDFQQGIEGTLNLLVTKSVNSAFYGEPNLEHWLRSNSYEALVICGITTNFCCETTTRMAGNLGFKVEFVLDATRTFDTKDLEGNIIKAEDVARMTAANLTGEFAQVVSTEHVLNAN